MKDNQRDMDRFNKQVKLFQINHRNALLAGAIKTGCVHPDGMPNLSEYGRQLGFPDRQNANQWMKNGRIPAHIVGQVAMDSGMPLNLLFPYPRKPSIKKANPVKPTQVVGSFRAEAQDSLVDFMRRSPFYGADDIAFEGDESLTREAAF